MTLILFLLIIGLIIFIHELGHFIFAKRAGVYVYEFSLGMGKKVYSFRRRNDETIYSIRLFPIGGFVSMAGEEINNDENVPEGKKMYAKPWRKRFVIIIAGVLFNFIFAWFLLFMVGLVYGAPVNKPIIEKTVDGHEIVEKDIGQGDIITSINDIEINSIDRLHLELYLHEGEEITLGYLSNGEQKAINISPTEQEKDGEKYYTYGFQLKSEIEYGFVAAFQFSFTKFYNIIEQMTLVISHLISGNLSLDALSGPVGIFSVVDETASYGFFSLIMLIALISINVGFINLLPLPALDGGRLWFLIIEKIKGSPVEPQIENLVHTVGFVLLLGLILYITMNDIINLF